MKKAGPSRLGEQRGTAFRFLTGLRRGVDRIFTYREILLRSSDRVRYLRLTPRLQKTAALLFAAGLAWGGYASISFVEQRSRLADRNQEIERSQAAYGDLLAEVDRYQRHFASITRELESTQRRLLAQLDSEGLGEAPGQQAERDHRTAELRARMVVAQGELRGQLEALETDLNDIVRRNGSLKHHIHSLQSALAATESERAEVAEARRQLGRVLSETELELAHERSEKAGLAAELAERESRIADWRLRHAALDEARDALAAERDGLQDEVASLRAAKGRLADRAAALEGSLADWKHRHATLAEARDALAAERDGLRAELASERTSKRVLAERAEELKRQVAAARDEVEQVAAKRDRLGAELQLARADRAALERRLAGEREQLAEARDRVRTLEQRRAVLEKGTERLASALRGSEAGQIATAARVAELEAALGDADRRIAVLREAREVQRRRVSELSESLDGSRREVAALEGQLYSVTRSLDGTDRRAEALAEQRDVLRARLVEARREIAQQAERHDAVIRGLSDRTRQSIDTMEELLSLTGLNIEAVVDEASSRVEGDGTGGPFVPYAEVSERPHVDHPAAILDALGDEIRRWEALQLVLAATPLAAPLTGDFRISSHFGKRKDPLNSRLSQHEGLDMVAAYRSPVLATAPGIVAFAGWQSGYGRVVDLDHGFGITTRYAHLRRTEVEKGERVGFRQQIGQLGNSGRSTGAHVHYEVRYNGRPLDPLKFMKAANHVLKG